MAGIFINYRRDDAPGVAGRLGDRLAKSFPQRQIFMDVDAMKPGLDFVKQLDEQVSKCDVFLAVIGPSWLNAADEKGRRKLELPRDYVRIELASALKREIPVIPLLVNGAAMPSEDDLPDDLKSLANRHALELRHTRFAADSETIVEALNVILPRRTKWRRIAAGGGLALACVLAGLVLWTVQNEHYAFRLSDIFQTNPPAKLAPAPETRAEVSNAPSATKSPSSSTTTSMPGTASTLTSLLVAPSGRPTPAGYKRVALVVGNSTYQTVPRLSNPSRDAIAIAEMFNDAGFDSVDIQLNVTNLEFKRLIRKFETAADQADMAVVYYSGHGLEISGTNYLIPVDARLASDRDFEDEAVPLERLMSSADGARRLRLVILDACRENPFTTTMRRESQSQATKRAATSGLGTAEPTSTDTLIAYAAKAGSTVNDGDGQHSPYTIAPGSATCRDLGQVSDLI